MTPRHAGAAFAVPSDPDIWSLVSFTCEWGPRLFMLCVMTSHLGCVVGPCRRVGQRPESGPGSGLDLGGKQGSQRSQPRRFWSSRAAKQMQPGSGLWLGRVGWMVCMWPADLSDLWGTLQAKMSDLERKHQGQMSPEEKPDTSVSWRGGWMRTCACY